MSIEIYFIGYMWLQVDVEYLSDVWLLSAAARFEDHSALDGGNDGLTVIKQILALAPRILSNHG